MFKQLSAVFVAAGLLIAASSAQAVFIGDDAGNIHNHNVSTNTSVNLGNTGVGPMFDIALNPLTDRLYGVTVNQPLNQPVTYDFHEINTTTGVATTIGNHSGFINGLTFDSSGVLYGVGLDFLYTINLATGAAATIGTTGYNSSGDIAFDSSGNLFMSATLDATTDQLINLDVATGVGSLIGEIGYASVFGLNFFQNVLYGFTLGGETISINTATGAGAFINNNGLRSNGADGAGMSTVPEPSVIALMGLGLLGMGIASVRRKAA